MEIKRITKIPFVIFSTLCFLSFCGFFFYKNNFFLRFSCEFDSIESCNKMAHREYLKNKTRSEQLFTKVRNLSEKNCNSGDLKSCTKLGRLLWNGRGGTQDLSKAYEIFKNSCEKGNYEGCYETGLVYKLGRGTKINLKKSSELFSKSCLGGHFLSCKAAGKQFEKRYKELAHNDCTNGDMTACFDITLEMRKDVPDVILDSAENACKSGNSLGCATKYRIKEFRNTTNEASAEQYNLDFKACEDGFDSLCREAAYGTKEPQVARLLLSKLCDGQGECLELALYKNGTGGHTDSSEVYRLYNRMCDMWGAVSCGRLGDMYVGDKDFNTAKIFYQKSCEFGHGEGCTSLGKMYQSGELGLEDFANARRYFSLACDAGAPEGCGLLAVYFYNGLAGEKNPQKSDQLSKQACEMGDAFGCDFLAAGYEDNGNFERARTFYAKACDLGKGTACTRLGLLIQNNNSNFVEARRYFDRACTDLKDVDGCFRLALLFGNGVGGGLRVDDAQKLFEWACKKGHRKACGALR